MNDLELEFWNSYLSNTPLKITNPTIYSEMAGDCSNADKLLQLYLDGKKIAGSSLLKEYEATGEALPKVGDFWIILNSKNVPKCIVKTIGIKHFQFDQVPYEVVLAEGEGDLTKEYWLKGHTEFYSSLLEKLKISNLNEEIVLTEFFEVVHK